MAAIRVKVEQNEAFKVLPSGKYEGFLSDPEINQPKKEDGHPYLTVQFRTDDPELGERSVRAFFSFSPKALWNLIGVLEKLEIPHIVHKNDDGSEDLEFDPEDLAGKSVIAKLLVGTYIDKKGKEREQNSVDEFFAPV